MADGGSDYAVREGKKTSTNHVLPDRLLREDGRYRNRFTDNKTLTET